jgi:hypothetical protein
VFRRKQKPITTEPAITPETLAQAYASGRTYLDPAQLQSDLVRQALFTVYENAVAGRDRANDWWMDHGLSSEQGSLVFFLATEAAQAEYAREDLDRLIATLVAGDLIWTSYPYEDDMPEHGLQSRNGRQWTLAACRDELREQHDFTMKGN